MEFTLNRQERRLVVFWAEESTGARIGVGTSRALTEEENLLLNKVWDSDFDLTARQLHVLIIWAEQAMRTRYGVGDAVLPTLDEDALLTKMRSTMADWGHGHLLIVHHDRGLADSVWPKHGGNARNTGSGVGKGARGQSCWSHATGGKITASPILGLEGALYVATENNTLHALDSGTGTPRWTFRTEGPILGSPAVGSTGLIYCGSLDGKIYALGETDGSLQWSFLAGAPVYSSMAISPLGSIIVGAEDRRVRALDGATGQLLWIAETGDAVRCAPALSPDGQCVIVGCQSGQVYAIELTTGNIRWSCDGLTSVQSLSVSRDGMVFCCAAGEGIRCLEGAGGQTRWEFSRGSLTGAPVLPVDEEEFPVLFVGTIDGRVSILDVKSGHRRGAFDTGLHLVAPPVMDAENNMYVFGGTGAPGAPNWRGTIYSIEGETGGTQWELHTDSPVRSLAVGAAMIYAGTEDGTVHGIR